MQVNENVRRLGLLDELTRLELRARDEELEVALNLASYVQLRARAYIASGAREQRALAQNQVKRCERALAAGCLERDRIAERLKELGD